MSCSSPGDHQACHQDTQWTGRKIFAKSETILVARFHPCFYRPENHCLNILRATGYLMCLLHCQGVMFSLPTSCMSFGKPMVSKGNQLDRGSRPLRKTMDHMGKPIIQFSKQRKWENHVENHPQVEESHSPFPGIRSPPPTHPRCDTHDTWHILCLWPQSEPSLIVSLGKIDFSTHHTPGPFVPQGQFCHLPAESKFQVSRALKTR